MHVIIGHISRAPAGTVAAAPPTGRIGAEGVGARVGGAGMSGEAKSKYKHSSKKNSMPGSQLVQISKKLKIQNTNTEKTKPKKKKRKNEKKSKSSITLGWVELACQVSKK
jgi:hypothetical protein